MDITDAVNKTYGVHQLARRLLKSLDQAGYDIHRLTTADLISFDELHIMGKEATIALGKLAGVASGMRLLDVGCGVGGPARTLASHFGCRVVGVDLSVDYAAAARELSQRVGLGTRVDFHCADVLRLPFGEGTFDGIFLIHVAMNVSDKGGMLAELHRVLKPGGWLALWEVCRGSDPDVIYPVPWSQDPSFSHLLAPDEWMRLMAHSHFEILHREDATDLARRWVRARTMPVRPQKKKMPRPDLDLIMPDFRRRRANVAPNLEQGKITIWRALVRKSKGDLS